MRTAAVLLSVLVLASCSSAATPSGPDIDLSSSPATTSTVVMTSTTAPTTTTTPPVRVLELAPGDPLVIEDRLDVTGYFRETDADSMQFDVWFVVDEPSTSVHQRSAYLGHATLFRDGRVHLEATVPEVIAERTQRIEVAQAQPTIAGNYRIEGIPQLSLVVRVTEDSPPLDLGVVQPAPVDPGRQVLGENDLAGVEFGTRDDIADDRLVARFGPPTGRTEWGHGCVGEYRLVWWGGLYAEFRRDDPGSQGRLAAYRYGWPGDERGGLGEQPQAVAGLATHNGIAHGTTLAELRAIGPNADLYSGYLSFLVQRWHVPGTEIVALLDRDFVLPGANVVGISAPSETELMVC